jgi:glycosyltransferase involved in cell wall biosynthesis
MVAPKTDINSGTGDSIHVNKNFDNLSSDHSIILISGTRNVESIDSHNHYSSKINDRIPLVNLFQSILGGILSVYILFSHDIDIIYERHHLFGAGVLAGALLNTIRVTEVNGGLIQESLLRNPNSRLRPLVIYLSEKTIFTLTNGIIGVSPGVKKYLLNTYDVDENKIKIVENGCDLSKFKGIDDAKSQLSWSNSPVYIGFVGSLTPWHGLSQLISALEYLKCSKIEYKLVIVGEGRMTSELRKLSNTLNISENIIWVGQIPHSEVPLYMNAFDIATILKNPKTPGSPIKLFEYMASGVPIIATKDIDFKRYWESNYPIELVDYRSPEDISNKISKMAENDYSGCGYTGLPLRSWNDVSEEVSDYLITQVKSKH